MIKKVVIIAVNTVCAFAFAWGTVSLGIHTVSDATWVNFFLPPIVQAVTGGHTAPFAWFAIVMMAIITVLAAMLAVLPTLPDFNKAHHENP